ncbi:MAG: AAA family ATPase [Deinococcales bacterium]
MRILPDGQPARGTVLHRLRSGTAIVRYGGTVGRLMGDAVLAFFGAPVAHEDHAERAVWTALELQQGARRYGERMRLAHGIEFHVRVGVATGLVVFALVGDDALAEYTAMGDAANVASRLQTSAGPDSVLVAAETYALVRHRFEGRSVGPLDVKGRSAPVEAVEIAEPRTRPAPSSSPAGLSAPIVGRAEELARLRQALAAAAAGRGGLVLVTGEAGVGKSRLLAEVRDRAQASSPAWSWLEGRALSYGQALAYHPWRDALAAPLGITTRSDLASSRSALESLGNELGLGARHVAALEDLFLVPEDGDERTLDIAEGEELIERLGEAVAEALQATGHGRAVALILEDLHWADAASIALLERVAAQTVRRPVALVALQRPEPRVRAEALSARLQARLGDAFTELSLTPLAGPQASDLLASLVDLPTLPPELRDTILRKTEGNPFFLEEVVRDLIDAGHLVKDGERWRSTGTTIVVDIPDTLLGVLSARLDRLPSSAKVVAQTASVIGRTFGQRVLADVCALAPDPERIEPIDPHLTTLTAEDLVRRLTGTVRTEFRFKHALSQEAAYDSLLLRRRRQLHGRTAAVLERAGGRDDPELAGLLAHHHLRAQAWEEGARYALIASDRARRLYALEDGLRYATSAVEALDRLERRDPQTFGTAVLIWIDLALTLRRQEVPSEREPMLQRLERAKTLARASKDDTLLTDLLVAHANVVALSGFPMLAYPLLAEANDLGSSGGREPLALLSHYYANETLLARDPGRAAQAFDEVIELARKEHNRGFEAHALAVKAIGLARIGAYADARVAIERALKLARTSGSTIKEADVNIDAGQVYYELGEVERGLAHGIEGQKLAHSVEGLHCASVGLFVTGYGHLTAGRLREALDAFTHARQLGASQRGMEMYVNLSNAGRAQVELAGGRQKAVKEIEEAVLNAQRLGDDYGAGYLALEVAAAELKAGRAERALEVTRPALAHFRATGMRPYLARGLRLQADAQERLGRTEQAAASRHEADELRLWLDASLAASQTAANAT